MAGRAEQRVEPVQAAWRRLRRHLDRSNQFWLGFVFTSNADVAANLASQVKSNCESRSEGFLLLQPESPRELSRLLDQIERDAPGPRGCAWVQAVFEQADPALSQEWSDAWAVLLQSLNQRRDTLRSRLGGFVLAAPPSVKPTAMRVSTDLWSVVVYLTETEVVGGGEGLKLSFEIPVSGESSHHLERSLTLLDRFGHTRRSTDLDEAVAAAREAVATTAPSDPSWADASSNLGIALLLWSGRDGRIEDIADAVAATRAAVAATPAAHPRLAGRLSNLLTALSARFEWTGDLHALDEAIDVGRHAVAVMPPNHPERAAILSNLGIVLLERFEMASRFADADEAVHLARAAAADAVEPGYMSNLGLSLLSRFSRTGSMEDLDDAVTAVSRAVASSEAIDPNRATYLSNLAAVLRARSERAGQPADPDQAVALAREAVGLSPPDHPDRARYLATLSAALRTRFEFVGEFADLDEALETARAAFGASRPGTAEHVAYLANLAATLRTRSEHTNEPAHLDEAVDACRAAVAAAHPYYPGRAASLAHLAAVLRARSEHTHDRADLDDAVVAGRAAVAATADSAPERSTRLAELAAALRARFVLTGEQRDVNDAVDAARGAVAATLPDHPDQARHLHELGLTLWARFVATGRSDDYEGALNALSWAAGIPNAPLRARLAATEGWARLAAENGEFDVAADGYRAAVALLPGLAWHGLGRRSRVRHLTEWSSLPLDAAACAVRAGRPEEAVELLEHGRSVLLQQALHLRGDFDSLAAADPELARRLFEVREALDAPIGGSAAYDARAADQRMRLAREWDDLIRQARSLPGFERFLASPLFSDLRRSGADGPVAVVNVSRFGSHAFILTGTDLHVVELSALDHDEAVDRADGFVELNSGVNDREEVERVFGATLAWLWDTVAEPVFSALRIDRNQPAGDHLPRIWWCLTGRMALFPVHAAGRPSVGETELDDSVLDRAMSSYTPTLTALLQARARRRDQPIRQLVVGMRGTPGASLPGVARELDVLADFPVEQRILVDEEATKAAVLSALADCTWIHVTGASHVDVADPANSSLLLSDGPLTAADLASLRLDSAELAYLSANATAAGNPAAPVEFTSLAAALQFAGYRHVIAALWGIYDIVAAQTTRSIYRFLASAGPPDAARAAEAVHKAVRSQRARRSNPAAWAPYVHFGP